MSAPGVACPTCKAPGGQACHFVGFPPDGKSGSRDRSVVTKTHVARKRIASSVPTAAQALDVAEKTAASAGVEAHREFLAPESIEAMKLSIQRQFKEDREKLAGQLAMALWIGDRGATGFLEPDFDGEVARWKRLNERSKGDWMERGRELYLALTAAGVT